MTQPHMLDSFIENVQKMDIADGDKAQILKNLSNLKETKVNILITGATGAGKSSTINALFNAEKAKVGMGVDPETMEIKKFELDNVILWDSPGLGDGKDADRRHAKNIINKLLEKNADGELLIDLVLVVLDGSTRDLGTSFELITEVIIPNLGEDQKRLLIAINQADMAMKGRHWDYTKNEPNSELIKFLDEKAESTRKRIKEATGVDVMPIYYSAGYADSDGGQKPYNLSKLLAFILRHTKKEKRIVFAQDINQKKEMWEKDDKLANYQEEIKQSFIESVAEGMSRGSDIGGKIGRALAGDIGEKIGSTIGAVGGAVLGGIKSLFSW